MRTEGFGGRGGEDLNDARLLDGVRGNGEVPAGLQTKKCASKSCRRWFPSRQEGDDYCSDQCDRDDVRENR